VNTPPGVEDPISAIFDLSDRVAQMAPVVRRMYRYTATILVFWIIIMAIVALVTLRGGLFLSLLALLGLIAGVISLGLLRQTDRFFRAFAQRHRSIRLIREADPVVKIPDGRTPVERLARYLVQSNPRIESRVKEDPASIRYRVSLPAPGRSVPFDLVVDQPSGVAFRIFGVGEGGFAVVARMGPDAPTLEDVRRLENDVVSAASKMVTIPSRAILLRTQSIPLPEDVYEYVVGHPVVVRRGFTTYRITIEVITESPDGTYDFVPHVLGVP
jgi:hypothetical protein